MSNPYGAHRLAGKVLFLWVLILFTVSACGGGGEGLTPAPGPSDSDASMPLVTPVSQEPAAGVCGTFEAQVVEVDIHADIPDPRCAMVRAEQHLQVTNLTGGTIEVKLGPYEASLEPEGEHVFDVPFGDYLAPGVHPLEVSPCCGMQLWLSE